MLLIICILNITILVCEEGSHRIFLKSIIRITHENNKLSLYFK